MQHCREICRHAYCTMHTHKPVQWGPMVHSRVLSTVWWVRAHLRVPSAPGSHACGRRGALDLVPTVTHNRSTPHLVSVSFQSVRDAVEFCTLSCTLHIYWLKIIDVREWRHVDELLSLHYFRPIVRLPAQQQLVSCVDSISSMLFRLVLMTSVSESWNVVNNLPICNLKVFYYNVGTCESFFALKSNLESNQPSDSISNRIFESNRPYIPRKP